MHDAIFRPVMPTVSALACGLVVLAALLGAPLPAAAQSEPEISTGFVEREAVHSKRFMIAAANPHAAKVGFEILRRGGSATDAAIAAALILGLVEPQSSTLGGGGYMLHWSAGDKRVDSYDARETAPASMRPDSFLGPDGKPVDRAVEHGTGRAVGVPGQIRLFAEAHAKYGKLPWKELFQPAIELAEKGFAVSPRLEKQVNHNRNYLTHPATRAYFYDANGRSWPAGHILVNKPLAETLRTIAEHGADTFYTGAIAADIAHAVRTAPKGPAEMTAADIAAYTAPARAPVCSYYRRHKVCGMGPSTTGGLTVGMTLGMLNRFDLAKLGPESPQSVHLLLEALRLAYADREDFIADPDFFDVPVDGMLDPAYLARRALLIRPDRANRMPRAGTPPSAKPLKRTRLDGPGEAPESPSTSHIAVVDADGNAVSLTVSIGRGFGSGIMVRGFLLNSHMVSFHFVPVKGGLPVANRAEPGKRPRSSMAPTLAFYPDGRLRLVVGSPGGPYIIAYVAQTVIGVIDWQMDVQQAMSQAHFYGRDGLSRIEKDERATRHRKALEAMGHEVKVQTMTSGLHGIEILPDGTLVGGVDPRREGLALGE